MNFDRLRHVAERADLGGEREALLAVVIPERPGSFLHFCEVLGRRSVTESTTATPPRMARRSSWVSRSARGARRRTRWCKACAQRTSRSPI